MNKLARLLGLIVVIAAITACSNRAGTIQYEGDSTIKATLKVMTYGSKERFMEDVGNLFNAKYPNVEFELIPYHSQNYLEVIDREKPDVMVVSKDEYEQLVEKGQLSDIDILLTDDRFHVEGIVPEMVTYLRTVGKGKLYGIPAQFTSKALYYNKDLFDQYEIPYPEDQMTWEEVLQLAQRFPSEDGIYGFYSRNFITLIEDIALSRGIAGINAQDMEMNVSSESYKEVFEMVVDAYNSNCVTFPELSFIEAEDPFVTGASAMTIDFNNYIHRLHWLKEESGDQFDLNWEMVTAPVDERKRDISPYMTVSGIHVINKDSTQKQVAWDFVKFATGEQLAKARSKTRGTFSPVRVDHIYNPEGKRMESLYKLKPELDFVGHYDLLPNGVRGKVGDIITSEIKATIVGAKTLDEAIFSMQERGQQVLDQNPRD